MSKEVKIVWVDALFVAAVLLLKYFVEGVELELALGLIAAFQIPVYATLKGEADVKAAHVAAGSLPQPQATAAQSYSIENLPLGGHLARQFPDQLAANGYIAAVRKLEEQTGLKFAIVGPTKRWWSRWVSVVVWRVA